MIYLFLHVCSAREPAPDDAVSAHFLEAVEKMEAASKAMQHGQWILRRQERVGSKLMPTEVMEIKYRTPMDLYVHWPEGDKKGREMLFKKGWNGDKLRVRVGSWMPNLNLEPTGSMAMKGSRHSLFWIPISHTVDLIVSDTKRVRADPSHAPVVRDHGAALVGGESSHCFESDLPKQEVSSYYAHRVEVCVSNSTFLPTRIRAYDRNGDEYRLVEQYEFLNTKVNPGLSDVDFDPDNPAYDF